MEKIQRAIFPIAVFLILVVYSYTHMIIPSYPVINENNDVYMVKKMVFMNIESEAKIQNKIYKMGGSSKEDIKDYREILVATGAKLDKCIDNKECYIDIYNDFMSDNVTDFTRKQTRYSHVYQLGSLGKLINESFAWTY